MRWTLVLVTAAVLPILSAECRAEEGPAPVTSATRPLVARPVACPAWDGDIESASKCLRETGQITTSEGIGRGSQRSLESRAFMKLFHSKDAGDAFAALYGSSKTPAGKFWALLGLRFLKDAREGTLRADFLAADRARIGVFEGGCCGDEVDPRKELPRWLAAIDDGSLKGLVAEKERTVLARPVPCEAWDGDIESARRCLEQTNTITTSEGIGFAGQRSKESRAFMKLYHSKGAADGFAELYRSSKTSGGKFWALLGLHFLKDDREQALRADFMKSAREKVTLAEGGCCISAADPRLELPIWLASIDDGSLAGLVAEKP